MSSKIYIDELSNAVMERLAEYKDLATDDMKKAVKDAGDAVRDEIRNGANTPVREGPGGGSYKKSWTAKVTAESSSDIQVTVYSPTRYRIAHLLENGHAKRGGGRVDGRPHIAPAEEKGEKQLMDDIEKSLKG